MFEIIEELGEFLLVGHADTEDSLEGAIEKWETIVAFHEEHPDMPLCEGGGLTCSLCHKYHQSDCTDCPVFKYTGETQCRDTPYHDYNEDDDLGAAKAELQFLLMLKWKATAESLPIGVKQMKAQYTHWRLKSLVTAQRNEHDN